MKKIIIFTMSTGGGHNQVANTLKDELEGQGHKVYIINMLSDINKIINFIVIKGYKILYSLFPRFFGWLYKKSDNKKTSDNISGVLTFILERKTCGFVGRVKPDIIIGVHPFVPGIIGRLRRKNLINVPFVSFVTDFKAHQCYADDSVDIYITGSEYTKETLAEKGVESSKIYPVGIPLRKDFFNSEKTKDDNSIFTVLLMGGSEGFNFIKKAVESIVEMNKNIKCVVVCGKNKWLKSYLIHKYKKKKYNEIVEIYGYTDQICKLMNEADIIITKPGGITITEACSQNKPIIIPYYIPGHEEENAEFVTKLGIAYKINRLDKLGVFVDSICKQPEKVNEMKERISKKPITYYNDEIVKLINNVS